MNTFVMIRNKYPRTSEGIGELPLWEDQVSKIRVYRPLGNDNFYKVFDGSRLIFLVENGIFYDFRGAKEEFIFKYINNNVVRKEIEVRRTQRSIEKLATDYELTKYGHSLVLNSGRIQGSGYGESKNIKYSNGNYYINEKLAAIESLGGGIFVWFYKLWKEKRLIPYDDFVRIDFDETLLKREEAIMLVVSRYAGLKG